MNYFIYNLILILVSPIILGLLLTKKRCQRGLRFRLGSIPFELQRLRKPVIWIHAVSLGEVATIVPLLHVMKERYLQYQLVVSTVTETGREVVSKQLEGIALHCYAPIDFGWVVNRYVRLLKPHLFILVESEFWPNLLKNLRRHHVPICLLNGRISSRSFARYIWVKGIMKRALSCIDLSLMQSPIDADRIGQLGAKPETVHVTGNMKFDQGLVQNTSGIDHASFRTILKLDATDMLIVAGSTHPQEEECLLEAYRKVSAQHPRAVLLLAPRHIERASKLEQVIRYYGFPCLRRSESGQNSGNHVQNRGPRVILLDTRGELPFVYREGCMAYVGGTLVPVGGHNLLEPAQWGRPVMFGPYVDHCRDIANLLLEAGGGIQIQNKEDLVWHMAHLITHAAEAEYMGKRALEVVQTHRGVMIRNLQWIDRLLEKEDPASLSLPATGSSSISTQKILR